VVGAIGSESELHERSEVQWGRRARPQAARSPPTTPTVSTRPGAWRSVSLPCIFP